MIKLRFLRRVVPVAPVFLVLLALAAVACGQDTDETTQEVPIPPATQAVESQRPLTSEERTAVADFASQLQASEEEWAQFYGDFDGWMSGLTECLPSTAQESLREFGAGYTGVAAMARNLPRTGITNEMADLVAAAADQEETSIRHLRDRWLPGNVALFEAVEQARTGGSRAQNSVRDLATVKREELEAGPSSTEVAQMEAFSEEFAEIADAWDDFHDEYAALIKRENRLEIEELVDRYGMLVDQFSEILFSIEDLSSTEITADLIEMLQEVAEDELDAIEFLQESAVLEQMELEEEEETIGSGMETTTTSAPTPGSQRPMVVNISLPAQQQVQVPPQNGTEGPSEGTEGEATDEEPAAGPAPQQGPASGPEPETGREPAKPQQPAENGAAGAGAEEDVEEGLSPGEQMEEVLVRAESVLVEVDQSIEEIVEDKSAEQLADLEEFLSEFEAFVSEWSAYYEEFSEWRATNGGCDQVEVVQDLNEYSQRAAELARTVRDLPQTGLLLPVYVLVAESAERDANAMRTLANTWTPFAVDSFKAVDEERVASGRLRRQASIALEELQNR